MNFKPHDLRPGNILNYNTREGVHETIIDWQDLKHLTEKPDQFNKFHSGIPLTEERLLKLGFHIDIECNEYQYSDACEFTIGKNEYGWFVYEIKMDGFTFFKYVHQLQNLFYALTQTELSTKKD